MAIDNHQAHAADGATQPGKRKNKGKHVNTSRQLPAQCPFSSVVKPRKSPEPTGALTPEELASEAHASLSVANSGGQTKVISRRKSARAKSAFLLAAAISREIGREQDK